MLDEFARRESFEGDRRKFKAVYRERVLDLGDEREKVCLVWPQTYMNLSGSAVRDFLGYFGASTEGDLSDTLLVVHDDLDLSLGRLRYRARGSSGGHRGVQSVIGCLGHGCFSRLKVGIGREEGVSVPDFVLQKADAASKAVLAEAIVAASRSIETWLREGIEVAMNRFNRGDE